jgi:diguanylate cyclase (GGDEF)-like protein
MPLDKLRLPFEYTITYVVYLFVILIVILGVLVFLGLRYFLIKPVEQLSVTMHKVDESHNYNLKMPDNLTAFAEIKDLFETFENMMQKVDAAQAELRHFSEKDVLTGLHNRRKFNELAHKELNRSQHHDHPFAFLVLDLNKFKPINDRYGHDAGDEILIKVSNVLSDFLREEDILARVGGDEFVIVLPETNSAQAKLLADRIQSMVQGASVHKKGEVLSVGCSIGIAVFPDDGTDLKTLFNIADERMYANKNADR